MKIQFEMNGKRFESRATDGVSIAIPMDFDGAQPNHFGAPRATRSPLTLGSFTGDTRQGGSCNVDVLSMVPHCNGTHTETVGHIVDEEVFAGHKVFDAFCTAVLLTVQPQVWSSVRTKSETYRPALESEDLVIQASRLRQAFEALDAGNPVALIIRTTVPYEKKSVAYGDGVAPPFLTVDAMQWIVELDVRHLLVDFPSVDRMYDDGRLTNHHLFWQVEEQTHQLSGDSRQDKTITEMVLIPDDLSDGVYLLNLQVPALCTDAAPSQPVLYPAQPVD